jgi:hypothetical protein
MSDQFLEQHINIKCVKLGKNADNACAVLFEACGSVKEESSVLEWHKRFKESSHVRIANEDNAHHFLQY